jgi:hypothetical protein
MITVMTLKAEISNCTETCEDEVSVQVLLHELLEVTENLSHGDLVNSFPELHKLIQFAAAATHPTKAA